MLSEREWHSEFLQAKNSILRTAAVFCMAWHKVHCATVTLQPCSQLHREREVWHCNSSSALNNVTDLQGRLVW